MARPIFVATVQVATNRFEKRICHPCVDAEGTVYMDTCPKGTVDVSRYPDAARAAEALHVTVQTIHRRSRRAQTEEEN